MNLTVITILHYSTRFMFPPRSIFPRVWIGGYDTANDPDFMKRHSIGLIINCTRHVSADFSEMIPTYRIPIDDSPEWTSLFREHIGRVVDLMHRTLQRTKKGILVHCHAGVSRSSTVVAAYLITKKGYSVDGAISYIRSKKPETFRPSPVFYGLLKSIERDYRSL